MNEKELKVNKIYAGDNIECMKKLPSESIDCVITSPPYWGLRDYSSAADKIWDSDPNCQHEWGESYTRHQEAPGKTSLVKQKGLEYTVTTHTCIKCGAWRGQFGLEPHPNLYIKHLVDICREIKRVLKKTGSFYLNLGDSYWGGAMISMSTRLAQEENANGKMKDLEKPKMNLKPDGVWLRSKQLLLIPARVAQALQEDGWILRNDIIWNKPNPMPTSVIDRLNNTYEHIFFFVKDENYFYDLDVIREKPSTGVDYTRKASGVKGNEGAMNRQSIQDISNNPLGKNPGDFTSIFSNSESEKLANEANYHVQQIFILAKERERETYGGKYKDCGLGKDGKSTQEYLVAIRKTADEYIKEHKLTDTLAKVVKDYAHGYAGNPSGKNPGDIFTITVQPFAEAHFAVFPPELARKPMISSCPKEICTECGSPRERILEDAKILTPEQQEDLKEQRKKQKKYKEESGGGRGRIPSGDLVNAEKVTVGWTKCECGEPFAPGVVLDPFNGSGTTCLVAKQEGRRFIGFDINPEYCEMARNRISKVTNTDEWGGKNYNYPLKSYFKSKVRGYTSPDGETSIAEFGASYEVKTHTSEELDEILKKADAPDMIKDIQDGLKEIVKKEKKKDEEEVINWEI